MGKQTLIQPYFMVVDKPPGFTSHDVVSIIRAVTGIKKIGHTGTLDPFATGVLPLAIGTGTRLISILPEWHKGYTSTLKLGEETDTGDLEGEVIQTKVVPPLNQNVLSQVFENQLGVQMQTPPRYAAIRINGKRLYEYARAGIEVDIPAREVEIRHLDVLDFNPNEIEFEATVSKGTYIRSLGETVAKELGTYGHLTQLRRIFSGPFTLTNSLTFEKLSEVVCGTEDWKSAFVGPRENRLPRASREEVRKALCPYLQTAHSVLSCYPCIELDDSAYDAIQMGQQPDYDKSISAPYLVLVHRDRLTAVCHKEQRGWRLYRVISSSAVDILSV